MDIDKAIKSRQSIRKFSSRKPNWRTIIECIDAVRYAPIAGNNYSLRFILVSDKNIINTIADAAQQSFIKQVHYVVVACSSPKRTLNAYGADGEIYLRQQAGAAIQNFLLKLESKGLATCWIGYLVENQIQRALDIPKDIRIEAVFPIGYKYTGKHTKRKKIELDRILYFDGWEETQMKPLRKVDA